MTSIKILKKIYQNISLLILATLISCFNYMTANANNNDILNKIPNNISKENVMIIHLKYGPVIIEMLPKVAPKHVERIKTLISKGFYDGIVFHRVIEGFMAQTGDPTGSGMGGSKLPDLNAEFSNEPHIRGTLSMARAANVNSANSQFFIVTKDSKYLDGQYTVWGRVISGMEYVDKIKKGVDGSGIVNNPDKMIKVVIAKDIK